MSHRHPRPVCLVCATIAGHLASRLRDDGTPRPQPEPISIRDRWLPAAGELHTALDTASTASAGEDADVLALTVLASGRPAALSGLAAGRLAGVLLVAADAYLAASSTLSFDAAA